MSHSQLVCIKRVLRRRRNGHWLFTRMTHSQRSKVIQLEATGSQTMAAGQHNRASIMNQVFWVFFLPREWNLIDRQDRNVTTDMDITRCKPSTVWPISLIDSLKCPVHLCLHLSEGKERWKRAPELKKKKKPFYRSSNRKLAEKVH